MDISFSSEKSAKFSKKLQNSERKDSFKSHATLTQKVIEKRNEKIRERNPIFEL